MIVHRFTKGMVTHYKNIKLSPEVQIVINMDGFGRPELKYSTYNRFIHPEPIQFTGFKLFYKNDTKESPNHLLTPEELMKLQPRPYISSFSKVIYDMYVSCPVEQPLVAIVKRNNEH